MSLLPGMSGLVTAPEQMALEGVASPNNEILRLLSIGYMCQTQSFNSCFETFRFAHSQLVEVSASNL